MNRISSGNSCYGNSANHGVGRNSGPRWASSLDLSGRPFLGGSRSLTLFLVLLSACPFSPGFRPGPALGSLGFPFLLPSRGIGRAPFPSLSGVFAFLLTWEVPRLT